jgi:uncharacterized membrane protein
VAGKKQGHCGESENYITSSRDRRAPSVRHLERLHGAIRRLRASLRIPVLPEPAITAERAQTGAVHAARLIALVIILKPFSNLLLAYGERHFSSVPTLNPFLYVASLFDPFVAAGVLLQIWWLLSRMRLFSTADLSFVIPVTAVGYVLTSLLGKFFLHEIVTPVRWSGIALVCVGSMLVAGTRRSTTGENGA